MELKINRGFKTYDIVDEDGTPAGTIRFNPADPGIAGRFATATKEIEKLCNVEITPENLNAMDETVKAQMDFAFGAPVSGVLFGANSSLAFCANGKMLVENILDALLPVVKNDIEEAQKAVAKRMEQHTAPYQNTAAGLAPEQL